MATELINIPLDDVLKRQMEDILNEKEISIETADSMLRKMAYIVVQQKNLLGLYNDTDYLTSIPGMKKSILEGRAEHIEECLDSVGWDIN